MTFETASAIFMVSGTILFIVELRLKHPHMVIGLSLAAASIVWAVFGAKYWIPTFPNSYGWMGIFIPIIGIISAVTILAKATDGGKKEA